VAVRGVVLVGSNLRKLEGRILQAFAKRVKSEPGDFGEKTEIEAGGQVPCGSIG
jgi:hypothetical protein